MQSWLRPAVAWLQSGERQAAGPAQLQPASRWRLGALRWLPGLQLERLSQRPAAAVPGAGLGHAGAAGGAAVETGSQGAAAWPLSWPSVA